MKLQINRREVGHPCKVPCLQQRLLVLATRDEGTAAGHHRGGASGVVQPERHSGDPGQISNNRSVSAAICSREGVVLVGGLVWRCCAQVVTPSDVCCSVHAAAPKAGPPLQHLHCEAYLHTAGVHLSSLMAESMQLHTPGLGL